MIPTGCEIKMCTINNNELMEIVVPIPKCYQCCDGGCQSSDNINWANCIMVVGKREQGFLMCEYQLDPDVVENAAECQEEVMIKSRSKPRKNYTWFKKEKIVANLLEVF